MAVEFEVLVPLLLPWIEYFRLNLGHRIDSVGSGVFETIADSTGEPQIIFLSQAAFGFGDNVFDLERDRYK